MKRTIFKGMMCLLLLAVGATSVYAQQQQRKDTLVVARDGTGEYRNIQEAVEAVRAFMDYTVTIYIKNGIYKEKLVIPSWVKNVQLVGESAEKRLSLMMTMPISIRWVLSVPIRSKWKEMTSLSKI